MRVCGLRFTIQDARWRGAHWRGFETSRWRGFKTSRWRGFVILNLILLTISGCKPYRYFSIETNNPASITFPLEKRRLLIVNNALPQDDVPFESPKREKPESITITADSTDFDFCRTLGEILAGFQGFDDVRLLEGGLRQDMSPFNAPALSREEVELLCDEHESDIVISLDRLLFKVGERIDMLFGLQMQAVIEIDLSGVLRVYSAGRVTPMTTILLTDTLAVELEFEYDDSDIWQLLLTADQSNLLRESARHLADEARKHFVPYWSEDVRWYFTANEAQWKEATACVESEKWDKALELWQALYERTSSWKRQARLCSNMALGCEMTGDLDQALLYAKMSHQLMLDHLGADDTNTKKQEIYLNVLSSRITENKKLQLQL